jgi:peroxiredoxin
MEGRAQEYNGGSLILPGGESMRKSLRVFSLLAGAALVLGYGCGKAGPGGVIRVELTRDDNVTGGSGQTFSFDEAEIAKELEKIPTKFPDPLPADARKVMFYVGRVMGFVQPAPGRAGVLLTLDVNMNRDLSDDGAFEVPEVESVKNGVVMKLARTFTSPSPRTDWLPYRIAYEKSPGPDGKLREILIIVPNYDYKGEFRLGEKDFGVRLFDGDLGGRFVREKQVNVYLWVGPKDGLGKPGVGSSHRFFELVPIGGSLYEIRAVAEDGSWVEFAPSGLSATALGKKAPDFGMTDTAGKTFHVSDYRGKVLVLDFWYVWCKPCIAKFPAIKKMIESYSDAPLAAVGVNIDRPERVEQAMQVIADNGLTWRQVVEGKAEFLPAYQVFGRLPERPMTFPIYVAIDEKGISRYATNDFEKMGRYLEAHFRDPLGPDNTLFVPLGPDYGAEKGEPPLTAVDFDSPEAIALAEGGKLALPAGLPAGARVGRMPNGIALVVYPGRTPDKIGLILDADGNSDLTNDEACEVPVLDVPAPGESQMARVDGRVYWKSGAIGFGGFPFFARPSGEVLFQGMISNFAGAFFGGRAEYRLELTDPNGDRMLTKEDWDAPGLLRLKVRKGESWVPVHEGTSGIPIGRSLYRVRHISDDGYLIELEKEK